jgi:type IV pilus assembly protein PilA
MKNQKSMGNKGFSLVELIVVIAIMAVLVGVLAPQFIKYVAQSKRSTDITNAQSLASSYLADIADGTITNSVSSVTLITDSNVPSAWSGSVQPKSDSTYKYYYKLDVTEGTVEIYIGKSASTDIELYPGADAEDFKNGDKLPTAAE